MVRAFQTNRRVRQDRKKRHDPGASQSGGKGAVHVDLQKRGDGDDRGYLQDHRVWKKRHFHPFRLGEGHGKDYAARDSKDQCKECQAGCGHHRRPKERPVFNHRLCHQNRPRQDVMRHFVDRHIKVPGQDRSEQDHRRQEPFGDPVDLGPAGARQLFLVDHGGGWGVFGKAHAATPMASCRASEAERQWAAYSAEVRNSSVRG